MKISMLLLSKILQVLDNACASEIGCQNMSISRESVKLIKNQLEDFISGIEVSITVETNDEQK